MQHPPRDTLEASYFDGRTAKARDVVLRLAGHELIVTGVGVERRLNTADVQWPERTRHGIRVAHFPPAGGFSGSVQCADAAAWDAWRQHSGQRDSWVVKAQQSWRGVLVSVLLLMGTLAAVYQWGLPWAARAVVALTPVTVDTSLGEATLAAIDDHLMKPSELPADEQSRLRTAFAQALAAQPAGSLPAWQLVFRKSRLAGTLGPNAFALPGGTMVMTDEMVALVAGDDKVITAVLAHELGHVQHRHGLRMLVQATVLAGVTSVVLSDFSTLLAGVPLLLGQASYSRAAEKEADAEAVRILKAAGISPGVMVTLFEKLQAKKSDGKNTSNGASMPGIAFASHPSDAERIAYFRQAAAEFER
jgi:Zn-dependent protease with chaperone function